MRVAVEIVMMHRALEMVTVEAGHRGGRRDSVLMVLHREAARRPGDEILKTQIRVAAATSASTTPGEFEASPALAAPLHAIEG